MAPGAAADSLAAFRSVCGQQNAMRDAKRQRSETISNAAAGVPYPVHRRLMIKARSFVPHCNVV